MFFIEFIYIIQHFLTAVTFFVLFLNINFNSENSANMSVDYIYKQYLLGLIMYLMEIKENFSVLSIGKGRYKLINSEGNQHNSRVKELGINKC